MRVVVDKIPIYTSACFFSTEEKDDGYRWCKLDGEPCKLYSIFGNECPNLKEEGDL